MKNIHSSMLFMLSNRLALKNLIKNSDEITENQKIIASLYVMHEASDFEILNLLVNGELPSKKYDKIQEVKLIKEFQKNIESNLDLVHEIFEEDSLKSILYEIDILDNFGISSDLNSLLHYNKELYAVNSKLNEDLRTIAIDTLKGEDIDKFFKKIGELSGRAKEEIGKILNFVVKHGKIPGYIVAGISATVLTAAIIYGSFVSYDRIFKESSKACSDKIGDAREKCRIQYEINANKERLEVLENGLSSCKESDDKDKCVKTLNVEISKIQNNIKKLEDRLSK